jgi:hypothetical protein
MSGISSFTRSPLRPAFALDDQARFSEFGAMAKLWPFSRLPARKIAASGLALLFLLHLIAALGPLHAAARAAAGLADAASVETICRPAAPGGGHAPAPDGASRCLACAIGCVDAAHAPPACVFVARRSAPPAALAPAPAQPEHAAAAGWRSSWSSRAPPRA